MTSLYISREILINIKKCSMYNYKSLLARFHILVCHDGLSQQIYLALQDWHFQISFHTGRKGMLQFWKLFDTNETSCTFHAFIVSEGKSEKWSENGSFHE